MILMLIILLILGAQINKVDVNVVVSGNMELDCTQTLPCDDNYHGTHGDLQQLRSYTVDFWTTQYILNGCF